MRPQITPAERLSVAPRFLATGNSQVNAVVIKDITVDRGVRHGQKSRTHCEKSVRNQS